MAEEIVSESLTLYRSANPVEGSDRLLALPGGAKT